jgi:hypothetical protein
VRPAADRRRAPTVAGRTALRQGSRPTGRTPGVGTPRVAQATWVPERRRREWSHRAGAPRRPRCDHPAAGRAGRSSRPPCPCSRQSGRSPARPSRTHPATATAVPACRPARSSSGSFSAIAPGPRPGVRVLPRWVFLHTACPAPCHTANHRAFVGTSRSRRVTSGHASYVDQRSREIHLAAIRHFPQRRRRPHGFPRPSYAHIRRSPRRSSRPRAAAPSASSPPPVRPPPVRGRASLMTPNSPSIRATTRADHPYRCHPAPAASRPAHSAMVLPMGSASTPKGRLVGHVPTGAAYAFAKAVRYCRRSTLTGVASPACSEALTSERFS